MPGRVIEGHAELNNRDCAEAERNRIATAQALAALVGLTLHRLADGAWLLAYAAFGGLGQVRTLPSIGAAEAALAAFEGVRDDVHELVRRIRSSA